MSTATATRTAESLHIVRPDGTSFDLFGKRALAATAIVGGTWDEAHAGGWQVTLHATQAAAVKAAAARRFQSGVRVIPVA